MMIDVILPTYNRASKLDRAIRSVLNQSYSDFNLYVIDDGSTDDTPELLKAFAKYPKFNSLRQKNQGVSAARNAGIKASHSPWLAFLDSDDEWLPHKLKRQVEFIQTHPACRFVHSNEIWVRNDKRVNPPQRFDKSNRDIFRRSLELCLISPSTVMIQRELSETHGHFDESFEICEDYDLWLKILATEEVGFISENLIHKYGGHSDQLSAKYPAMDLWRIRSMVNLLKKYPLDLNQQKLIQEEIGKKTPILLQGFLKHGNESQHQELLKLLSHL